MKNHSCYLCGSTRYRIRPGHARDNEQLLPLECMDCGLVMLSSFDHITGSFYEDSHMHDAKPVSSRLAQRVSTEDSIRRFRDFVPFFTGKRLLDIGCGSGDFLALAKTQAKEIYGVEPDRQWLAEHERLGIPTLRGCSDLPGFADVITMFHVLEHIPDPRSFLRQVAEKLEPAEGRLIIEVPSANDALLTLYENEAFSKFTYWSCHLYLHTQDTLQRLLREAGFHMEEMRQYQRYPLANHLYWLAKNMPGGQVHWNMLDNPILGGAYADILCQLRKCDTLIGIFSLRE